MRLSLATLYTGALSLPAAFSLTISEINGNKFLSPYIGQAVTQVTGLITAKGPDGLWLRSTIPDNDRTTSDSIYVFGRTILANRTVGDIITLDGKVTEFRSSSTYLYLTQISSPSNVATVSSGNEVTPLVLGKDNLNPPTEQYTSLDNGDVFGVPNNVSLISRVNPILEPEKYGLDFWESLMGELVTIQKPRAVAKPNNFRDTWVVGKWKTSGDNKRGGLTMTDRGVDLLYLHIVSITY